MKVKLKVNTVYHGYFDFFSFVLQQFKGECDYDRVNPAT